MYAKDHIEKNINVLNTRTYAVLISIHYSSSNLDRACGNIKL